MFIVFRTDANPSIGTGHAMRCLALAEALHDHGGQCLFLCRGEGLGSIGDRIANAGHQIMLLPEGPLLDTQSSISSPTPPHAGWLPHGWQWDAAHCREVLVNYPHPDWLVVDHYALDTKWEAAMRPIVGNCLVIDDLADRDHNCDMLVDQNLPPDAERRYDKLTPSHCSRLVGPRFALLRNEFASARQSALERRSQAPTKRLIVMFGGADVNDLTGQTVDIIHKLQINCTVDVVVGPLYTARQALLERLAKLSEARLHVNPGNIAQLMSQADLAIGSPGVTSWERCSLGLPTIAIAVAANQETMAEALARLGAHLYLGRHINLSDTELPAAIRVLADNAFLRQNMTSTAAGLTDGQGAQRIARRLAAGPVKLRHAEVADARMLYEWRNDPLVRRHALNSAPIPWASHGEWFKNKLKDSNTLIWVAQIGDTDMGCVRFDLANQQARISIYLAPEYLGRSLATPILKAAENKLALEHPDILQIVAEVKADNEPSRKAFASAGYQLDHRVFIKTPETASLADILD